MVRVSHRAGRLFQRWLYLSHRWLGIGSCILFAAWFVSGVVMMYVQFPALSDDERRQWLPPLDPGLVRIDPAAALSAAGQGRFPRTLRLEMLGVEPVWRLTGWDGRRQAVSAADGRRIDTVPAAQALAAIRMMAPDATPAGAVTRDQWTVTARYDSLRPFHLVALHDAAGTELYVSAATGEIALDTTRSERLWNWLGAIPHWIYFTPLRADAPLWRDVVLWLSGPGIVVAVSGLWIGIQRLRLRRRYSRGRITPYRGWMQWHHLSGLIGSLFLVAWIFSGWLSMNPNHWFGGGGTPDAALQRYAGHAAPDFPLPAVWPAADLVDLHLTWLGGHPLLAGHDAAGRRHVAGGAAAAGIFAAARALMPEAGLRRQDLLTEEDAYWYSHHHRRRLPVLRAVFDDPEATWFHLDPETGEILGRSDASRRAYRWLFNALHSFDFAVLLRGRPAWDILLWTMSGAGLVISVSGIVIGWRRLRRRPGRR